MLSFFAGHGQWTPVAAKSPGQEVAVFSYKQAVAVLTDSVGEEMVTASFGTAFLFRRPM